MRRAIVPLLPFLLHLGAAAETAPGEADFPGEARLLLPPAIHALEGLECGLYFENAFLLLDPARVVPDVSCAKGSQQRERWTWTPKPEEVEKAGEAGGPRLLLELRDGSNAIVARASTQVRVGRRAYRGTSEERRRLLVVGDSLTAASVYPARLLELAREDGFPLELIGTRGPGAEEGKPLGEVKHEGYGGWTAERFANHFTGKARGGPYRECGSPFLYRDGPEAEPRLDFMRYCEEVAGGGLPDFVTVLLGCNDTFSASDETIEERIDSFLGHAETLVAMFREAAPEARIGLVLPMPPASSQDAFGANYGSGQTRWQYLRNRHRLVERMGERFAGREKEGVHLVAAHLQLDPVHGFPSAEVPPHAHSESRIVRQNNGVHPSAAGYRQIGDAIYAWLRSSEE